MLIEYKGKEQDWGNEQTRYWFTLSGTDYGTGVDFQDNEYAIVENDIDSQVINCEGIPLTESDWETIAIRKHCVVTDRMRME